MLLGRRLRRSGQATTEYILVTVLVAILSIGVITAFGNQLRDLFRVATERMGGIADSKLDASITSSARGQVNKSMRDLKEQERAIELAREIILLVLVIVAGFTDLAYGKVYNWCSLPALAAGLLLAYWTGGLNDPEKFNLLESGYGLLLAGGIFGVFFALGAFGAGDLKLAAAIGALNGWRFALVAIVYSSLVGGLLAFGLLIWKGQLGRGIADAAKMAFRPWRSKKTVGPESPARLTVPYGFAIAVGTMWAWFFFYVW